MIETMGEDYIDKVEDDGEQPLYEHFRIVVDKGQEPLRIDKFLLDKLHDTSRNRIQRAADAGFVYVNGRSVKSNYKVKPLEEIGRAHV